MDIGARHTCNQDDKLDSYMFTHHDPREGAVQVIKDSRDNVKLTIEWLKVPGGEHGGSWGARVKGEPLDPGEPFTSVTAFAHNV
jgi:mannosyl-oligosaccharide glucosidase